MKILLDCSLLSVGGGVQVGLSVIHYALSDKKLQIGLICTDVFYDQLTSSQKNLVVYYKIISNSGGVFMKNIQSIGFHEIERVFKPDIVFVVFGPSYWRSNTINVQGFALGKMLYNDSRTNYQSRFVRFYEQCLDGIKKILLKRNVDYFIVETEVVKNRLSQLLKIDKSRVYVVGNSYSPEFARRCEEKKKHIFPVDNKFVIFVPASYYHHKNLDIIPYVACLLKAKGYANVQFVFTIDEKSRGWTRIKNYAIEADVINMIHTIGEVPNKYIADYYLSSHAVLCSSLVESSTAVFPESFMAKKPLLVSDRDFARDLCGDAALYFDPLSSKSIAEVIMIIINDKKLIDKMVYKGSCVLKNVYPSPCDKWTQQRNVLAEIIKEGRLKRADKVYEY